jgi:RNA polymerase sigma-70 factor, ECF subfamily
MTDFERLYERYAQDVYRFALYLSGSPARAEDIASETFVRVWTTRDSIRAASVKAYLFTIARNLHADVRRREARQVELPERLPDPAPGPEAFAEARQELTAVLAALQHLPEIDRAALLMRAQDGQPNLLRAINPRHNPTQATLDRLLTPFGLRLSLAPINQGQVSTHRRVSAVTAPAKDRCCGPRPMRKDRVAEARNVQASQDRLARGAHFNALAPAGTTGPAATASRRPQRTRFQRRRSAARCRRRIRRARTLR